jgi:hypothetical protein
MGGRLQWRQQQQICEYPVGTAFFTSGRAGNVRQRRFTPSGREVVAITNGKFDFGPLEQIFYGEFDGHRSKRVLIKVIGEHR